MEKSSIITKLLFFLLVLLLITFFWQFHHNQRQETFVPPTIQSSPTNQPVVVPTKEEAIALVQKFEDLQEHQDAEKVMKLFTPSQTPDEANAYSFIMGMDISSPRLYMTASFGIDVTSYSIDSVTKKDDRTIVEVTEQRRDYENTTATYSNSTKKVYFDLIHEGLSTYVMKYHTGDEGKYTGFSL